MRPSLPAGDELLEYGQAPAHHVVADAGADAEEIGASEVIARDQQEVF